jgi:hypothetical protein
MEVDGKTPMDRCSFHLSKQSGRERPPDSGHDGGLRKIAALYYVICNPSELIDKAIHDLSEFVRSLKQELKSILLLPRSAMVI